MDKVVRRSILCLRCRAHCTAGPSHVVSPRDLWLCVLPRWHFNVNVHTTHDYTAAFRLVSHETFKMAFSAVHLSHATEPTTSRQR